MLWQKVSTGCISQTVRCRKLIPGRGIDWGCRCGDLWHNLDLTFDLAIVILTFNILSGLYHKNHNVY